MDELSVADLREELRRRGLLDSGNRRELVRRLERATTPETSSSMAAATSASSQQVNFRDVEGALNPFSGDDDAGRDVRQWVDEFEDMGRLCCWTDMLKVVYARRLLTGSARLFVQHEKCATTWDVLKAALLREFSPRVTSRDVHQQLMNRKKQPGESYQAYLYVMLDIAAQAKVEVASVLAYVVDGIPDSPLNKAILYGATDVRDFKSRIANYEAMKKGMKRGIKAAVTTEQKSGGNTASGGAVKVVPPERVRRCFNCGETSHLSAACPSKGAGPKCFVCGGFGHIAARCVAGAAVNRVELREHDRDEDSIIEGTVNGAEVNIFVDTGSDLTLLKESRFRDLKGVKLNNGIRFRAVGCVGSTLGGFDASVNLAGHDFNVEVQVVPDGAMKHDLIAGRNLLKHAEVSFVEGRVSIIRKLPEKTDGELLQNYHVEKASDGPMEVGDVEYQAAVTELVKNYKPCKVEDPSVESKLILQDEVPVVSCQRRLCPSEQKEVEKPIEEQIDKPQAAEVVVRKESTEAGSDCECGGGGGGGGSSVKEDKREKPVIIQAAKSAKKKVGGDVRKGTGTPKKIKLDVEALVLSTMMTARCTKRDEVLERPQKRAVVVGNPTEIISDGETEFTSAEMQESCEAQKTKLDQMRKLSDRPREKTGKTTTKTETQAKTAIEKIQEENRKTLARKKKAARVYKCGDVVAIKGTARKPGLKFCAKFLGPYRVERVLRGRRYVVIRIGDHEGPRQTTTAAEFMNPWPDGSVSEAEEDD